MMAPIKLPIIPVILAGGAGKRLAPLSTPECPKPFVCLPNGYTLLHQTLQRVCLWPNITDILLVTSARYARLAQQEINSACLPKHITVHLLLESHMCNTGAAVASAARWAQEQDKSNTPLWFVPADQWIQQPNMLLPILEAATTGAKQGKLILFGMPKTHASTEYGYLRQGTRSHYHSDLYEVEAFIEKPNAARADDYFHNHCMWWNSGMICAQGDVLLSAIEQTHPSLHQTIQDAALEPLPNMPLHWHIDYVHWPANVGKESFDVAVLEKVRGLEMVCAKEAIGWHDMGTPEAFAHWPNMS